MNEIIMEPNNNNNDQISLKEFALKIKVWWNYFLSKWYIFLIVGITCGSLGVLYAYFQKPEYTATLTFAPEGGGGGGSLGAYAGIASQFGFNLGMGGDAFEGENLVEIMRSRRIIEKTLFTKVNLNGHGTLIINDYIKNNKLNKNWPQKAELQNIKFDEKNERGPRVRDSILNKIIKDLRKQVKVYKIDKKVNIYAVELTDEDEYFAANFVAQLTNNTIDYYVNYIVGKSRSNVNILEHQLDSVRRLLNVNIVDVAAASDLNVNPIRQIVRTGVVRRQIDVQANGTVYGELLKQLEVSKISLRRETPLIQIIDEPRIPLERNKPGRLKTAIIFSLLGSIVCFFYLLLKRLLA